MPPMPEKHTLPPDSLFPLCGLVVQALQLNTLSKLTFADSKRFNSLVADVFVDVALNMWLSLTWSRHCMRSVRGHNSLSTQHRFSV